MVGLFLIELLDALPDRADVARLYSPAEAYAVGVGFVEKLQTTGVDVVQSTVPLAGACLRMQRRAYSP